jgi:hypothetical protein
LKDVQQELKDVQQKLHTTGVEQARELALQELEGKCRTAICLKECLTRKKYKEDKLPMREYL